MDEPLNYQWIFNDYLGMGFLFYHHPDDPTDAKGRSGSSGGMDKTVQESLTRAELQQLTLDYLRSYSIAYRVRLNALRNFRHRLLK